MGRPDVYRRIVSIFCFIGYVWHVICLKAKKPNDFGTQPPGSLDHKRIDSDQIARK